jgi:hypothetical protein
MPEQAETTAGELGRGFVTQPSERTGNPARRYRSGRWVSLKVAAGDG